MSLSPEIKLRIITEYLQTIEGQRKLTASMTQPLRLRQEFSSLLTRLMSRQNSPFTGENLLTRQFTATAQIDSSWDSIDKAQDTLLRSLHKQVEGWVFPLLWDLPVRNEEPVSPPDQAPILGWEHECAGRTIYYPETGESAVMAHDTSMVVISMGTFGFVLDLLNDRAGVFPPSKQLGRIHFETNLRRVDGTESSMVVEATCDVMVELNPDAMIFLD